MKSERVRQDPPSYEMWTMPRRSAMLTAAVRSLTPSFARMLLTCTCTVPSLMPSDAAISLLRRPCVAWRQRWVRGSLREPRLDVGAPRPLARMHVAHDANQVVRERVLEQIGRRARMERPVNVLVSVEHRQHHDAGAGVRAADRFDRLGAAQAVEPQVHQRHVGLESLKEIDRFLAAGGRGDHLHVGLLVDDECDSFPDDAVIVDAEDPYLVV